MRTLRVAPVHRVLVPPAMPSSGWRAAGKSSLRGPHGANDGRGDRGSLVEIAVQSGFDADAAERDPYSALTRVEESLNAHVDALLPDEQAEFIARHGDPRAGRLLWPKRVRGASGPVCRRTRHEPPWARRSEPTATPTLRRDSRGAPTPACCSPKKLLLERVSAWGLP